MAKIYKGAFSGTLPITVSGTGTGVLASYRIFGNDGGVGVETEASGYKLPILSNSVVTDIYIGDTPLVKDEYVDSTTGKIYRRTKNLSPPEEEWMDEWIWGDGTIHPSTEIKTSPFIDVSTCETCIMEVFSTETEWAAAGYRAMAFYDENKQYLGWIGGGGRRALTPNSTENWSEFPAGTVYVRIGCSHGDQPFYPQLVSGYTPTHQFYPYLVPTDPPAPLPEIPTFAGTTAIDYAGEGLAPSQFDGVAGWGNLPVKKLNGVPYTGTLPAILTGTRAGYLYKYEIYGSTEQTGTPTPENPIVPSGCGVRTENLFDKDNYNLIRANAGTGMNILYGNPTECPYAVYIPVTGGETYSFYSQATLKSSCFTMATPAIGVSIVVNDANTFNNTNVRTAPADAKYLVIFLEISSVTQDKLDFDLATLTIVKSSTPPASYIPYGYKLPLTVNGVEYPIYLGEVETTRRIKKLVLDGTEAWAKSLSGYNAFYFYMSSGQGYPHPKIPNSQLICNIATFANSIYTYTKYPWVCVSDNTFGISTDSSVIGGTTVDDWKSYLAAQYANGTPVTVWYVLAEPETGIVNEPLMKIGDYADTIDSTQTTAQLLTAAGETTISWAGEGLAPSQFDSIQEWVDIPTYTYTNGAWVADN